MSHSFSAHRHERRDGPREMPEQVPGSEYPSKTSQTYLRIASRVCVTVTDPQRIDTILLTLSQQRVPGVIRVLDPPAMSSGEVSADAMDVELAPGPTLLVSAAPNFLERGRAWTVELQGAYALFRFRLEMGALLARGRFIAPTEIDCIYRRNHRRVSAPPGAKIRFTRRQEPGRAYERALLDVGFCGVQFLTEPDDSFEQGEELCDVEATWKHGPQIPLDALVRHVSSVPHARNGKCGLSVVGRRDADTEAWYTEISSLQHPETATSTSRPPEELWDLYEESGYFGLGGRDAGEFHHLREDFVQANSKLERAPRVSCRVVREFRGRVEATISMLHCWSQAWLAYQGARRQSENPMALSGNAVLRDMYLHAYERVQLDPDLKWNVAYIRKDARFTRLANHEFAHAHNDGVAAAIVPFRALQFVCDRSVSVPTTPDTNIAFASSGDLYCIVDALSRRFPRPYLEAYDFVEQRFDLSTVKAEWAQAGLLRERRVLVLTRGRQAIAAAIMDLVESGVYLVGLADSVHLVELGPDARRSFPELLAAVHEFYRQRGHHQFMLFEEGCRPDYALALGARDLGEADQIFMSASLTPEFLDNICYITASTGQVVL